MHKNFPFHDMFNGNMISGAILWVVMSVMVTGTSCNPLMSNKVSQAKDCRMIESGFGPRGEAEIEAEVVVNRLEVPWALAFLPNGDALVTERAGRLRLIRDIYNNPQLMNQAVATVPVAETSEGGLLGLALHPDFEENHLFYLYVTVSRDGKDVNQVERWKLSEDNTSAQKDKVIYSEIRAASFHNGGRLRFGPDGMLYVGTGDARNPDLSQDPDSPNGKLLRLTPEGEVPDDNPFGGSPAFITGIRNTQGWAWPDTMDAGKIWLIDHGPSGEMLRFGHDEVNIAMAGDNLGWPEVYGCQQLDSLLAPALSWQQAVPPAGTDIYTGESIPQWKGSLMIGTLESQHLHRVQIKDDEVELHEVYLHDEYGRLRDVVMGADGHLYVTTSNCDGRGDCPSRKDVIIRITGKK